jgi:hypothetical protein
MKNYFSKFWLSNSIQAIFATPKKDSLRDGATVISNRPNPAKSSRLVAQSKNKNEQTTFYN